MLLVLHLKEEIVLIIQKPFNNMIPNIIVGIDVIERIIIILHNILSKALIQIDVIEVIIILIIL